MSIWAKSNNESYVNLDRASVVFVRGDGSSGTLWSIMAIIDGSEWFLGSYETRERAQSVLDEMMDKMGEIK